MLVHSGHRVSEIGGLMKLTKVQMAELQVQTITDEDSEQYFIIGNTKIHIAQEFVKKFIRN